MSQKNHPDTNVGEGHLGGYIRGRQSEVPTVYGHEHGDPATWTPELWRWVFESLGVRSVLDVGCGEGHAAGFFRDLGCCVLGVDGSLQARRDSVIRELHITHDFARGGYFPAHDFDLVWSCEFVEHVEERHMANFLATFASSTGYLMMTFASPGQPGHHHVNCQPAEYWVQKLAAIGFSLDEGLTEVSRAKVESGHYHNCGLLFTRR
ncbi:MAG: class I SAM-dependent methyltransferase [bacterium]|nr:class I SAM-dependent methyltransferase [bacterium]